MKNIKTDKKINRVYDMSAVLSTYPNFNYVKLPIKFNL